VSSGLTSEERSDERGGKAAREGGLETSGRTEHPNRTRTDEEIAEYSRRILLSYHHQVGPCKMGIDRMAVTVPDLRGTASKGLRVADASVMPTVTSGNTNAVTIMIRERSAAFC
jgi:choline dehydrogenase-like flavoprotein